MPCCKNDTPGEEAATRKAGEAESPSPGQGGSPMEMMQKMMAQMGKGGGPPPMQKMMGMCSEMLTAIRQTAGMAVFATPDLQRAFNEWLKDIEAKAQASIIDGAKDAAALAAVLKIDEASARYILGRLAADGKVTLTAHART